MAPKMHDTNLSFTSNQENGNSNMRQVFVPNKLEKIQKDAGEKAFPYTTDKIVNWYDHTLQNNLAISITV